MMPLHLQLMTRANSSPSRLRMTALTIPEHEAASLGPRTCSGGIDMLPPIRKVPPFLSSLTSVNSKVSYSIGLSILACEQG